MLKGHKRDTTILQWATSCLDHIQQTPPNSYRSEQLLTGRAEQFPTLDPILALFWTDFSKAHNHVIIVFS